MKYENYCNHQNYKQIYYKRVTQKGILLVCSKCYNCGGNYKRHKYLEKNDNHVNIPLQHELEYKFYIRTNGQHKTRMSHIQRNRTGLNKNMKKKV